MSKCGQFELYLVFKLLFIKAEPILSQVRDRTIFGFKFNRFIFKTIHSFKSVLYLKSLQLKTTSLNTTVRTERRGTSQVEVRLIESIYKPTTGQNIC